MSEEKRHKFTHEGKTVYEWSQSLSEVELFIDPPPGVKARDIDCTIAADRLTLGLKGNPPFINERFPSTVKVGESFWTLEDGELHISLQKTHKGETWPCALVGHAKMDELDLTEDRKKMMLERFQEENPGFDFSGAEFSGAVPDPKSFMGGVSYTR